MGSSPDRVKPKTIKLVFVASLLIIRRKSTYWLARNKDNVSEWGDMSTLGLVLVGYHYKIYKLVGLIQSGLHHHLNENSLFLAMM